MDYQASDKPGNPGPARDQQAPVFRISELSREFGLTTRTIRHYEDEGLLHPRRSGRQRLYSLRDHTRLKLILRGKRLGFSLLEIREMLDLYDSEPGEAGQLELAIARARERKQVLLQQMEDIQLTLDEIRDFEEHCQLRLGEVTKQ